MLLKTKTNNKFIIIIFLLIVPWTTINCQLTTNRNIFSPQNRLRFGNYLYNEKDYLRAANEYREFLKYTNNDTIQFRFANSFYKIGRFQEASDNFKVLFFSPSISEKAKLMFYESNFFGNDYKSFRALVDQGNFLPQKYLTTVDRLKYSSYFLDDSLLPDANLILDQFADTCQTAMLKFYQRKKFPEYKSLTTTTLLSAFIPGAGKIYIGEISDGITAFITTALSAYLAYDNFKSDHQFRGWLFTGLAAFFYGRNVYGSAASAQIYNARIRFNLDKEIKLYFEQRNYFLPDIDF